MKKQRLLVFLLIPFLASCYGRDIGNLIFPISQAFEVTPEGEYVYYLQILNPSSVSKVEVESGQIQNQGYVIKGQGKNLYEAVLQITKLQRRDSGPEDIRSFILHESTLNNPEYTVGTFIEYMLTNPAQRNNPWLFITREKINDLYAVSTIRLDSLVYNLINTPQWSNMNLIVNPITAMDALVAFAEDNRAIAIPLVSINKELVSNEKDNESKPRPTFEVKEVCFNTRETNRFECLGVDDLNGLRFYQQLPLISLPVGEGNLSNVVFIRNVKHSLQYEKNQFTYQFKMEYQYVTHYGNIDLKEFDAQINQKIREELEYTWAIAKAKNIDIYHLYDYAKRYHQVTLDLSEIDVKFEVEALLNMRLFTT